jgi:hypothetical protein
MKKELEIKILEEVTNGTLTKDDMLRRLLKLYGVSLRYFYHYSYISPNGNINSNELIECTKDIYDKLKSDIISAENHKPVKYMSDNIPKIKKLRKILYTRC